MDNLGWLILGMVSSLVIGFGMGSDFEMTRVKDGVTQINKVVYSCKPAEIK